MPKGPLLTFVCRATANGLRLVLIPRRSLDAGLRGKALEAGVAVVAVRSGAEWRGVRVVVMLAGTLVVVLVGVFAVIRVVLLVVMLAVMLVGATHRSGELELVSPVVASHFSAVVETAPAFASVHFPAVARRTGSEQRRLSASTRTYGSTSPTASFLLEEKKKEKKKQSTEKEREKKKCPSPRLSHGHLQHTRGLTMPYNRCGKK